MDRLSQLVEAALYCADGPVSLTALGALERDVTKAELLEALEQIRHEFNQAGHGVELVEVAEGYQLLTRREFADAIARAHLVTRPRRLTAPPWRRSPSSRTDSRLAARRSRRSAVYRSKVYSAHFRSADS